MKSQSVTTNRFRMYRTTALCVIFGLLLFLTTGCDELSSPTVLTTFDDAGFDELAADISNDLGLSQNESQDVRRAFTRHQAERGKPGYFWLVAAEMQKNFTEEQMERVYALINRYEAHLADNGKFMFFQGWPSLTGQNRDGAISCAPNLTEEQVENLKEIRKAYAEELEVLKNQFNMGELTEEEYIRSVQALITALHQEFFELLTEEQKARWRRCMAMVQDIVEENTSPAFHVMVRVLQLNREQIKDLVALQLRLRNAYRSLIQEFREGDIDRDEFIDGLWEIRDKRDSQMKKILEVRQYEIVKIHQALMIRAALNRFRTTYGTG
jgi:hypothetical protein